MKYCVNATVYVSKEYLPWQQGVLKIMKEVYEAVSCVAGQCPYALYVNNGIAVCLMLACKTQVSFF